MEKIITQARVYNLNNPIGKCYYSNQHILLKMEPPIRKDFYEEMPQKITRKNCNPLTYLCLFSPFNRKK